MSKLPKTPKAPKKLPTAEDYRQATLQAGMRRLREFGYPACTVKNILTTQVYAMFFQKMLEGTLESRHLSQTGLTAIQGLLDEVQQNLKAWQDPPPPSDEQTVTT